MLAAGKARGAVVDKNFAIDTTTYTKKFVEKDYVLQSMLNDVINSNILFRHCKNDEKVDIVDAFESIEFDAGIDVITQGDPGDNFYIVEEGSLDVYIDNVGKVRSVQ
jgi:CRP-like cAMP-binding protein